MGDELVELLLDSHRPLTGAQIRFIRKQIDLSQTELAKLIGKRQPHIARAEARDDKTAFESYTDQFALITHLKAKWSEAQNKTFKPEWDDFFSATNFENQVEPRIEMKRA